MENKKRIVMIRSNSIEPDSRVEKAANTLHKAGYKITLLAWDRDSNYLIRHDRKKLAAGNIPKISFGARAAFGAGMKSLPAYLKFQISLFLWLLINRKHYDYCHLCDFDTAFTGSIACRILRKKYVFDIFDYLSTDAHSFFERCIEKAENNIINHANATIICTKNRARQIKKATPRNLTIIHNSPDIIPGLGKHHPKNDKVKIAYIGILQDYRLLPEMVHAISQMENIEFHIAGFGKYESYMKSASEKYNNIFYYGKISYEDTLRLESVCDLMTAIYDPKIGNHRYAAPNKFYEALYLGKPLIMVKKTGMSEIVKKYNVGTLIDYSEEGFVDGLKRLIHKQDAWEDMGVRMKKLYNEQFSWQTMETRLIELYQRME